MSWVSIILLFALVDNVILSRLLGVCPSVGAPGSMRTAAGIVLGAGDAVPEAARR